MARTVADVAFLDAVITREAVPQTDLRDVRIGIPRADYWEGRVFDPGVEKTTQEAFSKLRDAGALLIEIDLNALLEFDAGDRLGAAMRRPNSVVAEWLTLNVPGVTMEELNRFRDSYPPTARSANALPPLSPEETREKVVPAGLTSGLPVGLSLQGLPGDDSRILGLGIAVEEVLGPIPPPPK